MENIEVQITLCGMNNEIESAYRLQNVLSIQKCLTQHFVGTSLATNCAEVFMMKLFCQVVIDCIICIRTLEGHTQTSGGCCIKLGKHPIGVRVMTLCLCKRYCSFWWQILGYRIYIGSAPVKHDRHLVLLDSKVHGTNMWTTWVLSSPGGPYVGPMILAIRAVLRKLYYRSFAIH